MQGYTAPMDMTRPPSRAWRARFRSGRIIVTGIARHLQGTVQGAAIAALLVQRHKRNLLNLLAGTEGKIGQKAKTDAN